MAKLVSFVAAVVAIAGLSITASATSAPTQLSIAFGSSVPTDPTGQTQIETDAPTRISGGEHFTFYFSSDKTISDVKIIGYSASKLGKILIHTASGLTKAGSVDLPGLYTFASVTAGNPGGATNYDNLVMLPDSTYVEVQPNQAFGGLDIVVEGFTNNDESMLLQITSADGLPTTDFVLVRPSTPSMTLGSYVNEANYANFALANMQMLMDDGVEPPTSDLAGKTYSCTSYTKLNPTQVDFKTRTYALVNGVLQSSSDQEGENMPWATSADGLELALSNIDGCGQYTTYNVVRETAVGNLISEIELNLNAYITECTAAGYDASATLAVEDNSTFPSIVNPSTYVVDSYEFCHPVQ